MTASETAQIITALAAVGAMVVSAGGLVVSLLNRKNIAEVHRSTNGKMEELVKEVREASFARGVKSAVDKEAAKDSTPA